MLSTTEDTFIFGPNLRFQGQDSSHIITGSIPFSSTLTSPGSLRGFFHLEFKLLDERRGEGVKQVLESCRNGFGVELLGHKALGQLPFTILFH